MKWRDEVMNETLTSIRNRRSIRAYRPEQIKDEELNAIIEAGLYAPSAMNQQSWHVTVIQNKEVIGNMVKDIKEHLGKSANPRMQQMSQNENFNPFYDAPTLIVISGDEKAIAPQADCAAALENMMVAAYSLGVGSCWVNMIGALFASEKGSQWKKDLGIPEGYKPLYSTPLGYSAVQDVQAPARKENAVNYIR